MNSCLFYVLYFPQRSNPAVLSQSIKSLKKCSRFALLSSTKQLQNSLHARCVEVHDQRFDERHLFPRILQNHRRILARTPQTIGREHGGQIRRVHFRHRRHLGPREDLEEPHQKRQHAAVEFGQRVENDIT